MKILDILNTQIKLPSLPQIAVKILEAVEEDKSFEDLAQVIRSDPALSAKVLQIANSALFALPSKVDSLSWAVSLMGVERVKNIALSFAIVRNFSQANGFDYIKFWKFSITAATSAEILTSKLKIKHNDPFTTALLMDIGQVVMYLYNPQLYQMAMEEWEYLGVPLIESEQKHFSFDHQIAGSEILARWNIPETIYLPIRYHHNPQMAPKEYRHLTQVLYWSDKIARVYHQADSSDELKLLEKQLVQSKRLSAEEFDELLDNVALNASEIISTFDIPNAQIKPYSVLLEEANEKLKELNLSYERLLVQLKQKNERIKRLTEALKRANKALKKLAYRDILTGLYNRRLFEEVFNKEVIKARRYGLPLSLIFADIDSFKQVNDTYGHLAGDVVLKQIAAIFKKGMRASDIVARYGGEEFITVLPNTSGHEAVAIAERIRRAVKNTPIELCKGVNIRITISCGVSCYFPKGEEQLKPVKLIQMADKALYKAKTRGKDRVCYLEFVG